MTRTGCQLVPPLHACLDGARLELACMLQPSDASKHTDARRCLMQPQALAMHRHSVSSAHACLSKLSFLGKQVGRLSLSGGIHSVLTGRAAFRARPSAHPRRWWRCRGSGPPRPTAAPCCAPAGPPTAGSRWVPGAARARGRRSLAACAAPDTRMRCARVHGRRWAKKHTRSTHNENSVRKLPILDRTGVRHGSCMRCDVDAQLCTESDAPHERVGQAPHPLRGSPVRGERQLLAQLPAAHLRSRSARTKFLRRPCPPAGPAGNS